MVFFSFDNNCKSRLYGQILETMPSKTFRFSIKFSNFNSIQENRRKKVKEHSKALTKALQKPFSFDQRTNLRRSRSLSALDTEAKKRKEGSAKFHARPMPHHIFE